MTYEHLGHCPRCGVLPHMKAVAGQFFWGCNCPQPQTYTTNNTVPITTRPAVPGKIHGDD